MEREAGPEVQSLNYDKLYHAVSVAESTYKGKPCNTPWHIKAKNCVSIMSWKGGKRHLKPFSSFAANKAEFISLWKRSYGGKLPTLVEATRYSGGDNAVAWLNTVLKVYNSSTK